MNTADDELDSNPIALSDLSLREAIFLANNHPGPDKIYFDPAVFGAETSILIDSQILISDSLSIIGPGAELLTIDAQDGINRTPRDGDGWRIFEINDGNADRVDVEISRLTLSGGDLLSDKGGAVLNDENLALLETTFVGNSAPSGGGVHNRGELTVVASYFSDNQGVSGGAIFENGTGLTIVNSTFSYNIATANGGAIWSLFSDTLIRNTTIVGNRADSVGDGNGGGGGISGFGSTTVLHNTIVAGNLRGTVESAIHDDITSFSSTQPTGSHNLIGDPLTAGALVDGVQGNILGDGNGNLLAVESILQTTAEPISANRRFHALVVDSLALDAGDNAMALDAEGNLLPTDQRDSPRFSNGIVDIGAFELQAELPAIPVSVDPFKFDDLPEDNVGEFAFEPDKQLAADDVDAFMHDVGRDEQPDDTRKKKFRYDSSQAAHRAFIA